MKAYSEDLRQKIVEALDHGTEKSQAARLFGVSLSSVKRYAKMAREGRPLAPRKARQTLEDTTLLASMGSEGMRETIATIEACRRDGKRTCVQQPCSNPSECPETLRKLPQIKSTHLQVF